MEEVADRTSLPGHINVRRFPVPTLFACGVRWFHARVRLSHDFRWVLVHIRFGYDLRRFLARLRLFRPAAATEGKKTGNAEFAETQRAAEKKEE